MTNPDAQDPGLMNLVVLSLSGEPLAVTCSPHDRPGEPSRIAQALREAGWSSERLIERRDARRAAGLVWPDPISAAERDGVGAAQLHAVTQAVLAELGVSPEVRLRDRHVPLSARDQDLLAQLPPHHGVVG